MRSRFDSASDFYYNDFYNIIHINIRIKHMGSKVVHFSTNFKYIKGPMPKPYALLRAYDLYDTIFVTACHHIQRILKRQIFMFLFHIHD